MLSSFRIARTEVGSLGLSMRLLFFLLLCVARATHGFFAQWGQGRPTAAPSPPAVVLTTAAEPVQLRIRTTQESDIPAVASFLSTAIVGVHSASSRSDDASDGQPWNKWKTKMDHLWAQSDIEALLRGRCHTITEGKAQYRRVLDKLQNHDDVLDEELRLKLWWDSSRRFQSLLQKASTATGEANAWQQHNFALSPPHRSWLQHVQMTAEDTNTGLIVGFCEVAMLSNPLVTTDGGSSATTYTFAPAITNLATAVDYRRQGIATRLLQSAHKYVQLHWQQQPHSTTSTLGLFVEQDNHAAIRLYEKMGYQKTVACPGGARMGDMWYMIRRRCGEGETEDALAKEKNELVSV